ncbi:O-antigen ligase family protein [Vibrio cholerae]|uniref:O-antigen ligase family protein n=1 Tax=Vibrio cholerae TaxID=666 RepID=UPI003017562E
MKKNITHLLILSPYLFLFTFSTIVENSSNWMVILSLTSIITSLVSYGLDPIRNNIKNISLIAIILFSVYLSLHYLYNSGSPSLIRSYLSAVFLVLFFPFNLFTKKTLTWLVFIGSLVLSSNSFYYAFYLDRSRDAGLLNVIPYATFCSSIALLAFYLFMLNYKKKNSLIYLISFGLSTSAVFLTLSRGVWLAFIIAIIAMFFSKKINRSLSLKMYTIFFMIFISLGLIFKGELGNRINQTIVEYHKITNDDYSSSIGLRLQMWEIALIIYKENFWFGISNHHHTILENLVNTGKISNDFIKFKVHHFHNQFIDTLVRFGVIGLILFTTFIFLPIYVAIKGSYIHKEIIIGISFLYIISGLTDVPLNHSPTILMYILMIIPLCLNNNLTKDV